MAETQLTPEELRKAADRIGGIMNDNVMSVFLALEDGAPTAGSFPTATWLHDRVGDRVRAVKQQARILKLALDDICTGLHTVADQMSSTDANNSQKLVSDFDNIGSKIATDTASVAGPPKTESGSG